MSHEDTDGEYTYSSILSLKSVLDGVSCLRQAPVALPQQLTRHL
jgi:hypothetical protein